MGRFVGVVAVVWGGAQKVGPKARTEAETSKYAILGGLVPCSGSFTTCYLEGNINHPLLIRYDSAAQHSKFCL